MGRKKIDVTELAIKLYEQGKIDGLSNKSIREDIELVLEGMIGERRLRQILPLQFKRGYSFQYELENR